MPLEPTQVNRNHVQAAAETHSPPENSLSTSKKRRAAGLEPPKLTKQRRVSKGGAQLEAVSESRDSTSEVRKSSRTKPAPTQLAPAEDDEEAEEITPSSIRARGKKVTASVIAQEVAISTSPKRIKKTTATVVKKEEEVEVDSPKGSTQFDKAEAAVHIKEEIQVADLPKKSWKNKKTEGAALLKEEDTEATKEAPKKVKRHRKTKEEKEAEAMPLAARTNDLRMFIGAHVSAAKGEPYMRSSQS